MRDKYYSSNLFLINTSSLITECQFIIFHDLKGFNNKRIGNKFDVSPVTFKQLFDIKSKDIL